MSWGQPPAHLQAGATFLDTHNLYNGYGLLQKVLGVVLRLVAGLVLGLRLVLGLVVELVLAMVLRRGLG